MTTKQEYEQAFLEHTRLMIEAEDRGDTKEAATQHQLASAAFKALVTIHEQETGKPYDLSKD